MTRRRDIVAGVICDLAAGRFDELALRSNGKRLTPKAMRDAIDTYGRNLLPLPESAVELIDFVEITASAIPAWSVVVPLFTQEEGVSDLSLELTIRRVAHDAYEFEIDDIHVL